MNDGGQPVDPVGEIEEGVFEGVLGAGTGRVGNRPVQAVEVTVELFVGVVADGDHEVVRPQDVFDACGTGTGERQACALAVATASGCTPSAGFVPAEAVGTVLRFFHNAAASWERAEL